MKSLQRRTAADQWRSRLENAYYRALCRFSPGQRAFRAANLRAIQDHGVVSWFEALPRERSYSREVMRVIAAHAERKMPVHDLGAGIGQELVELSHRGFHKLYGCDISPHQVRAAGQLLKAMHVQAAFRQADGVSYLESLASNSAGVVLALNWTYHLEPAALEHFIHLALDRLRVQRGLLMLDIIRSDYEPLDWEQDDYQRSYPVKWLASQFEEAVRRGGGEVFHSSQRMHPWGRVVYGLKRPE